jgi:hypothetical protein
MLAPQNEEIVDGITNVLMLRREPGRAGRASKHARRLSNAGRIRRTQPSYRTITRVLSATRL